MMKRILIVILVISVIGCNNSRNTSVSYEWRDDLEPLLKRFPLLADNIDSAYWAGGIVGGNKVPGPTLYYLKGLIYLKTPVDYEDFKILDGIKQANFTNEIDNLDVKIFGKSKKLSRELLGDNFLGNVYQNDDGDQILLDIYFE
jgi:hypothetical protein